MSARWPVLAALISHWRVHRLQFAMLILGLSLATGLWTGVQAINAEARAAYASAAAVLGQDRLTRLTPPPEADTIDQADFVALRRAGWLVSPVIEGRWRLGDVRLTLTGIEPLTLPAEAAVTGFGGGAGLGTFITPPGELIVAPATAERIAPAALQRGIALRLSDNLPEGRALADIGVAQRLLGLEGRLSHLLLAPDQPAGLPPLEGIAPHLRQAPPDAEGDLARLTDSFHLNLTAFGFLSFAVGLFIVNAAIGLAFEQRRAVFRTLRALGVPARRLMAVLLGELVLLALLAGVLGVLLGYGVAAALLPDVAATLGGLYGAPVPGSLTLRAEWWASGLGIALAGTLAAAGRGLWRVWRLPVLAPAQPRAWARASEAALGWQGLAAVALAAVAGAAAWIGGGVVGGFVLLGAMLMAAALALPVVLGGVLRLASGHARGALAQWFWADSRQQVSALSLALMALLLALSANIGVGTMVSSFRLTFVGWLDQRLVSELYVTARTDEQAAAAVAWLEADGRAEAILPFWRTEATVAGAPAEIYGVPDHATYRDHWPLIAAGPDPWDRVADGRAALVNEQLARRAGLWPGTIVDLPRIGPLPVAAVYSDYGNPLGQVIVSIPALVAGFPDVPRLSHAVRVDPALAADLAADLTEALDLAPGQVVDQAAVKALSRSIFDRTFAVTGALNVLTLGVAALALLASLVTLAGMRLAQLAPLWALGLTRGRLAALELARTLVLAVLTAVAALPVGLALAWALLAVINVEAFGWRLPMHVFPLDWLRLGGWALLAVLLAAAVPVWRLARLAPASLLRVFAGER